MRMLTSVKMNSPMLGSYVNPLTPVPKLMTIAVAEPYSAYPAATCLRPGWSASDDLGKPSDSFLHTHKKHRNQSAYCAIEFVFTCKLRKCCQSKPNSRYSMNHPTGRSTRYIFRVYRSRFRSHFDFPPIPIDMLCTTTATYWWTVHSTERPIFSLLLLGHSSRQRCRDCNRNHDNRSAPNFLFLHTVGRCQLFSQPMRLLWLPSECNSAVATNRQWHLWICAVRPRRNALVSSHSNRM